MLVWTIVWNSDTQFDVRATLRSQTLIQHHPHLAAMIVCEQNFLVIQYFDLLPHSIHRHKLQCTNSGTLSGFNCISFQCHKVGSDQLLQVTAVIRCYVMTTYTCIFPEVTGSLISVFKLIRDYFHLKHFCFTSNFHEWVVLVKWGAFSQNISGFLMVDTSMAFYH